MGSSVRRGTEFRKESAQCHSPIINICSSHMSEVADAGGCHTREDLCGTVQHMGFATQDILSSSTHHMIIYRTLLLLHALLQSLVESLQEFGVKLKSYVDEQFSGNSAAGFGGGGG